MKGLLMWLALGAAALLALPGCRHAGKPALSPREQARVHLADKEPGRALPLLERLHREAPADLDLARGLVEAHVRTHRANELIARLAAADEGRPPAVTAYMLGLARFAGPADADLAVADLQRAVELSPATAELHYRLGLALVESERFPPALLSLGTAHQLDPGRREVLLPLAKAHSRSGDPEGAVGALRKLVEAGPTPGEVQTARALMESFADPFGTVPRAARGKLEEGLLWLEERDVPQQAIAAFEEILREFPDAAGVRALLGLAWQRVDDAGRAVEEFKRAIELAPWDGRNHLYLGLLYHSRQRPELATTHFERALQLNPLLEDAWLHLGDRHLDRRELEGARRAFFALAHLLPESPPARGKHALVLQLLGDFPAADRELRSVIERWPRNEEFMLRLGLLHFERRGKARSQTERAEASRESEKWLRQVLQAQPQNAVASRALEALRAGK